MNKQRLVRSIRKDWTSGHSPISFSGISNIKHYYPEASEKVIQDALGGLDTYTLFRHEKRPRHYNPIFVRNKRELIQSDLIELSSLAPQNDGVKFLLVVIDTFSRYAWIEPLKSKNASEVLKAFKKIEQEMPGGMGKQLMTDQGGEYTNKEFQKFLKEKKIQVVIPNNKAPHVERFNRTFQNILYRDMEERQSERYINRLPILLDMYNNRRHRIINTTPHNAEMESNYEKVLKSLELYYKKAAPKTKRKPKFEVGDLVRISAHKTLFRKGYYQSFKPMVYKISAVLKHLPVVMYKITDVNSNKEEAGTWYGNELQYISKDYDDTLFKVEEIVKTRYKGRKKQALIKWKYWPEEFNSWEPFDEIKDYAPDV